MKPGQKSLLHQLPLFSAYQRPQFALPIATVDAERSRAPSSRVVGPWCWATNSCPGTTLSTWVGNRPRILGTRSQPFMPSCAVCRRPWAGWARGFGRLRCLCLGGLLIPRCVGCRVRPTRRELGCGDGWIRRSPRTFVRSRKRVALPGPTGNTRADGSRPRASAQLGAPRPVPIFCSLSEPAGVDSPSTAACLALGPPVLDGSSGRGS